MVVVVICVQIFIIFANGIALTFFRITDKKKIKGIVQNNFLYKRTNNFLFKHIIFSTILSILFIILCANDIILRNEPDIITKWVAYLILGYWMICLCIVAVITTHIVWQYIQRANLCKKIKNVIEDLISDIHRIPNQNQQTSNDRLQPNENIASSATTSTSRKRNVYPSSKDVSTIKNNDSPKRRLEL